MEAWGEEADVGEGDAPWASETATELGIEAIFFGERGREEGERERESESE